MKSPLPIPFFLLFLLSTNLFAQKNYKGEPKHQQPSIKVLPKSTKYILDQGLGNTLELKLNKKINELFTKHDIAGITATILIPDKGIWNTNRGFISKPDNVVVDSSSVFYWASVSKLITSTIIHQLVIEDKISLNDKLSKWFSDIQYARKITVEQLLNHTNGIYSFQADSTFHYSNKPYSPNEVLEISKSHKNLFKPGEYWSYSNTGYVLLALIIEKIESKTFEQVIKDRVAEPLSLTTLRAAPKETPSNLALAHHKDIVLTSNFSQPIGAGNIISNSKDMAIFLSAFLTGKIIPTKMVHDMMKNLYPMFDKGLYYGKGIMVYDINDNNKTNTVWIGHSGGTENYKAIVAYDTQTKSIIAVAINESIPAEAVAYKLMELVNE